MTGWRRFIVMNLRCIGCARRIHIDDKWKRLIIDANKPQGRLGDSHGRSGNRGYWRASITGYAEHRIIGLRNGQNRTDTRKAHGSRDVDAADSRVRQR
ncbi:MAG TPA: hypothetical protein VET84_06095, partial [Stellaceae bacterium]|nr:hypothetical protein [Stellaceae bacterium]